MFRSSLVLIFTFCIFRSLFAFEVAFVVGSYRSKSLEWVLREKEISKKLCIVDERDPEEKVRNCILNSRIVVLDVMMDSLVKKVEALKPKARIYCVNSSRNDEKLKKLGFIFDPKLRDYYANPLAENYKNMFLYALYLSGEKTHFKNPIKLPKIGIYHPNAPKVFTHFKEYNLWYSHYKKSGYWVGLLFYQAYLDPLSRVFLDKIIEKLEESGFKVFPFYCWPAYKGIEFLVKEKVPIEVLISFSFKMSASSNEKTKRYLKMLDVPVISAINLFSESIKEWRYSEIGLSSFEVSWQVGIPELSGLIEPTVLAGRISEKADFYTVVDEELKFLVSRVKTWISLRHKLNSKKRIAILYYNHAPGKQNIGASYLNVFKSLQLILKRLKAEGYKVDGNITYKTLKELILLYGRNIGFWAPGELKELVSKGKAVLLPIKTYETWYKTLPIGFRKGVEKQWGNAENASIMVYNGYFVFPVIKLGNVIVAPQPQRGVAGDAWKLYHSRSVYPHHQYIAFYLWLNKAFKADAVIHLGTHGTLEWLPGKEVGLDSDDPPHVLIQDMVDIYPYVVDDVGEGIQAKRRGWAVIIDHLTPPIEKANLYGDYSKLFALISQYKTAYSEDIKKEKLKDIVAKAKKLHLIPNDTSIAIDKAFIEHLEHKLIKLKEDLIPFGLHTFGLSPSPVHARKMASLIEAKDAFKKLMKSGPQEMKYLLKALSGGYVPPSCGNDPLVNPSSIPTGYNFYSFDPNKIPSPQAWRSAKKLVDGMLSDYLKKHHRYPKKVSVVLWATETVRNEGINEAQILWLIGMKPIWDKNGKVVGIKPISGADLGRPRIDVLVHASGLYRDMFPDKLKFLDTAIKRAALLKDVENFISENALLIEKTLVKQGLNEKEAKALSLSRVFSEKVGDYGTGVSLLTANTGFWNSPSQIAQVFLRKTGFIYGNKTWGKYMGDVYRYNLSQVKIAVHSISSNLYRALDNDDVFQYLGGVAIAVEALTGKFPEVKVARSNGRTVWSEELEETLSDEMRARYFNPKWIRGMKKEGYAGAREMSKFLEYLWGWQVTTPFAVKNYQWLEAYNVYVKDKYSLGLKEFFNKNNPWAYQSMLAWMLEAIRKGYWKAPEKIKIDLARSYMKSVVSKGVACCEHTCNNPFLNQFVVQILSIPGLVSLDLIHQFKNRIEKATGQRIEVAVKKREKVIKKLALDVKRIIKGVELKQEEKVRSESSSGMPWMIMLFSFSLIVILIMGIRRQNI